MKLSILICTLPERHIFLKRLDEILKPQLDQFPEVEIVKHDAGRHMTTGEKRNWLISHSRGEFFSFIDDDDMVATDYCADILKAIESNPDVVTFNGFMTTDGNFRKNFQIKLGNAYYETHDCYYRFPNHLCPVKRSAVAGVNFPHITVQEDYRWADEVRKKGLLKTSVHINKDLYHYCFRSKK